MEHWWPSPFNLAVMEPPPPLLNIHDELSGGLSDRIVSLQRQRAVAHPSNHAMFDADIIHHDRILRVVRDAYGSGDRRDAMATRPQIHALAAAHHMLAGAYAQHEALSRGYVPSQANERAMNEVIDRIQRGHAAVEAAKAAARG